jgi:hypothetical protein
LHWSCVLATTKARSCCEAGLKRLTRQGTPDAHHAGIHLCVALVRE